jgi:adenosylmethionine-8-amino-7-oxononanoate aminotransferase
MESLITTTVNKQNTMTTQEQLQIDKNHIWHPFDLVSVEANILIAKAQGLYLYTPEGRAILDAIGSWWVNIHGHAHPYIAAQVAQQLHTLEHVIFAGFTHQPAIQLVKNLLTILPNNQEKVFFSDNGSTATEVAIKMAFQYWHNRGENKPTIVAIEGAYHGDTFGAMSVGGRSKFNEPFAPYLFDVSFVDFPDGLPQAAKTIEQFQTLAATGKIAAFIYEPLIQGAAGMRMYSPDTLEKLLLIAKKYDIICIADEVMTGFGRTGKWFASLHCDTPPDIMCLSKGITGGTMAMGVTTCTHKIHDAFVSDDIYKIFFHGHSYTGNPLACAAANASFDLLMEESCSQNIARIALANLAFCEKIKTKSWIKEARCLGTVLAIEFKTDTETSYFNQLRDQLYQYFLSKDILLRPLGNIIYLIPPYIITDQELARVYEAIANMFDK